jgi:hypothetical protein
MPAAPTLRRSTSRRAQLERETGLPVHFMARCVAEDLARFLGVALPARCIARLAAQARTTYAHSPSFREKINRPGERGRDCLYMFLQHWLAAGLDRDCPGLYERLPRTYATGAPLPANAPARVLAGVGDSRSSLRAQ